MPTSVRQRSGIFPQEVIRLIHIQKESVSKRYALFLFLLYLAPKHRLTTERQPREERLNSPPTKSTFLKIGFLKKLTRILKLLTIFLKTFTPCCAFRLIFYCVLHPINTKKCTFPQKKCIFLYILTSFSSLPYYLCCRFRKTIANHPLPIAS